MFNPSIHAHLIALGFAYEAHPEDIAETGTGETGPRLYHEPAWDEYVSADWRVVVGEDGDVVDSHARDLEFEAWCDEQAAQSA